jgi:UDP-N-acetyl-D-mannosaminuronate dehydrogenase
MRNSQSFKIFNYFKKLNSNIFGLDPYLERNLNQKIIDLKDYKKIDDAKSIILLVEHRKFDSYFRKSKVKEKVINILK